jgi:hypothetical protein
MLSVHDEQFELTEFRFSFCDSLQCESGVVGVVRHNYLVG